MPDGKPRLAVFKFSSCDGCQLQILNLEDELLGLVGQVEVAYFLEASTRTLDGPYDLTMVEGSISTPEDIERIKEVRKQSKFMVTIGACANTGGIQALRNAIGLGECIRTVYANPAYVNSLSYSTPIAEHVAVDFAMRGCPISKEQLLQVVTSVLIGRIPKLPSYSVCVDCKRRGNVCVLVAQGMPCLGPVTMAGCGAVCPSFNRGCFACYGPMENANTESLVHNLQVRGVPARQILQLLDGISGGAEDFREAVERLGKVGA